MCMRLTATGGCVYYRSVIQPRTARSSMDSEMIGVYDALPRLQRVHGALQECLGLRDTQGVVIENDNRSLQQFLSSQVLQPVASTHLTRKYLVVHEAVLHRELTLQHVDGTRVISNGLTKTLTGTQFNQSRDWLLGTG